MYCEINQNQLIHKMPAGLLSSDQSSEVFGDRKTKEVYVLSKGETKSFDEIDTHKFEQIKAQYLNDKIAVKDLCHLPIKEAVKQYSFCLLGAIDSEPDFDADGNLKSDDNFICSNNCQCLKWNSKNISVDGKPLSKRKVEIIQLLATDLCDKQIADKLRISESTLDTHKTQLYRLFNVFSKPGLVRKAINQKIVQ